MPSSSVAKPVGRYQKEVFKHGVLWHRTEVRGERNDSQEGACGKMFVTRQERKAGHGRTDEDNGIVVDSVMERPLKNSLSINTWHSATKGMALRTETGINAHSTLSPIKQP